MVTKLRHANEHKAVGRLGHSKTIQASKQVGPKPITKSWRIERLRSNRRADE